MEDTPRNRDYLQCTFTVLTCFNLLFGIATSIMGYITEAYLMEYTIGDDLKMHFLSVTAIVLGWFLILLGCFGLYVAFHRQNLITCVYTLFLILVIICVSALVCSCFVFRVHMFKKLNLSIKRYTVKYTIDKQCAKIMDRIQQAYDCCGAFSYLEYGKKPPATCFNKSGILKNASCLPKLERTFAIQFWLLIGTFIVVIFSMSLAFLLSASLKPTNEVEF